MAERNLCTQADSPSATLASHSLTIPPSVWANVLLVPRALAPIARYVPGRVVPGRVVRAGSLRSQNGCSSWSLHGKEAMVRHIQALGTHTLYFIFTALSSNSADVAASLVLRIPVKGPKPRTAIRALVEDLPHVVVEATGSVHDCVLPTIVNHAKIRTNCSDHM